GTMIPQMRKETDTSGTVVRLDKIRLVHGRNVKCGYNPARSVVGSRMHMRELWIGMWMFMVFSVSTLRGQGPQLPPVPRVPISNANGIEVSPAVKQDESRALRSISPLIARATTANNEHFLGKPHPNPKSTSPD